MCTIIIGRNVEPELPLVVAANRDEALDRPAEAPRVRRFGGVRALAPLDLEAHGTWLGLNEFGLFVAITNRFEGQRKTGVQSRGSLVVAALGHRSAEDALREAERIRPDRYNGFHLVIADRTSAYTVRGNTEALLTVPMGDGWHVVTERSFEAAPTAREPLIRRRFTEWTAKPPTDAELQALLSTPHANNFDGVLVYAPTYNYGTRSSTLIRLRTDGRARFLHADGRPDRTPYADYSSMAAFDGPS